MLQAKRWSNWHTYNYGVFTDVRNFMNLKNSRTILTNFKSVQVISEFRVRLASQRNRAYFDRMAMTDFTPSYAGCEFPVLSWVLALQFTLASLNSCLTCFCNSRVTKSAQKYIYREGLRQFVPGNRSQSGRANSPGGTWWILMARPELSDTVLLPSGRVCKQEPNKPHCDQISRGELCKEIYKRP